MIFYFRLSVIKIILISIVESLKNYEASHFFNTNIFLLYMSDFFIIKHDLIIYIKKK